MLKSLLESKNQPKAAPVEKKKFVPGYHQKFIREEDPRDGVPRGGIQMLMNTDSDIKSHNESDNDKKPEVKNKSGMMGSDQFLDDCKYSLDLHELYTLRGKNATCSYNESMEYAPVLIKISDKIKHLHDPVGRKYNYLLQCWDTMGNKVFQLKL